MEETTITNSLMFRLVMEQPGMCKQLLECLLDTRIVSISPILRLKVHYASLAKSVIIFICTYDPFGHGLGKYSFSNLCHQDHAINMQDDALKIFFNANGDLQGLTEAQRHFLAFAKDGRPRDSFTEKLAEYIAYMQLSHEKWGVYMTYQQELLGREIRGEKRGEERGILIGEKRGITIGAEKVSKLYAYLSTKGLMAEMQRAFVDKEYRAKLVKQYAAQIT